MTFAVFSVVTALACAMALLLPFDTLGYDADAPDALQAQERLAPLDICLHLSRGDGGGGGSSAKKAAPTTESSPLVAVPP